jgi:hypothetical protein
MDWLDNCIRRRREEAIDVMRTGIGLDFVPRSPLNSVQIPAKQVSGRSSLRANQTTSFFLVSGFGSGAYSAKLIGARLPTYRFTTRNSARMASWFVVML